MGNQGKETLGSARLWEGRECEVVIAGKFFVVFKPPKKVLVFFDWKFCNPHGLAFFILDCEESNES